MTTFLKALLMGVAGSILFWLLDRSLLGFGGAVRAWGMIAALLVVTGLTLALPRARERSRRSIASHRRIGGRSEDVFDDVSIAASDDVEFVSSNVVKGDSKVTVGRLDIK